MILAQTFTPIYDELEDRVRLVINYNDIHNRIDFMITRSFMLKLLPTAEEFIEKYYIQELPLQNTSSASQGEENISKTDNTDLELYKTQEQLLQEINFSYDATSQLTTLTFRSKEFQAQANFNQTTIEQTFSCIKASIPNIAWGISHNF